MTTEQFFADDFLKPETLLNPHQYYQRAIAQAPVQKINVPDGSHFYLVTSHALIHEVFSRENDFCSSMKQGFLLGRYPDDPEIQAIMSKGWHKANVLVSADPPAHTVQRQLTSKGFSPRLVKAMEDHIRAKTVDLIQSFDARGECEFISEFVLKLLVNVIAEQVGAAGHELEVKKWTEAIADRMGQCATREREIECARTIVEAQHFIKKVIDDRRAQPRDDFMTAMVQALNDSPGESDEVLIEMVIQLLVGGHETGTITLSDGLLLLINNPELMNRLRENPGEIPMFVEEIARYISAVNATFRFAIHDTELGGVVIPKNSMVMLRLAAANRDPSVFPDPDRIDIDRPRLSNHLAFGRGIHICPGRALATLELKIAFEEVLSRLTNIQLAKGKNNFERSIGWVSTGLKELYIKFEGTQGKGFGD